MENIIKKKKQSIFDYIKNQKWFWGSRSDRLLLLYSSKRNSYDSYIKKEYGINFAETLLVPLRKNYPIRVFNLPQAKEFHLASARKIKNNPQILTFYVKKNKKLYEKIDDYGKRLLLAIEKKDISQSIIFFNKIFDLYEIASAQFFIIFSLGLKLTENKNNLKDIKDIIKKHNEWRNSIALKEETVAKRLHLFFKFLIKREKLKLNPSFFMRFLTLNEIQSWLNKALTNTEIKNIIKFRKSNGFVYSNLRSSAQEVIDNPKEIKKMQNYLLGLVKDSRRLRNNNEIKGQVAYPSNKIIKGEVVLIKGKSALNSKSHSIDGRILVAIQTTPHFILYIKKAKAIITDEGGLTCHAAILAREFKIPCIVGTRIATQILKDNDVVEINMRKGMIRVKK